METEIHIRRTLLSRKPRSASRLVTSVSFAVVSLMTLGFWENTGGLAPYLPAIRENVFVHNEWWRLFTALFIHADLGHYFSNLGPFLILCFLLHGYFGTWVYPIGAVLLGAGVNGLALLTYPPHVRLLGASGLVYGMGAFWLTLFLCVERSHGVGGRLLRALGFFLIFFVPASLEPGVSYRTHAIAFGIGLVAGFLYFLLNYRWIRAAETWETDPPPEPPDPDALAPFGIE